MTADLSGRLREAGRMAIDVLAYAFVIVPPTLVVALLAGIGTGGGLVRTKVILFVVGWALVMLATVRLWPQSPSEVDPNDPSPSGGAPTPLRGETHIEAVAAALPPRRWTATPAHQLSPPAKLFVSGLCVLLSSFVLETVFAVG